MNRFLDRDEVQAGLAGDRLAYIVMSFGLLAIVAYRSFVEGVASWELLGLLVLSGVVGFASRTRRGAPGRDSAVLVALAAFAGLAAGALLVTGLGS
jgi:hypothetical protein